MAENVRLRQRLEEMQEIVDSHESSATSSASRGLGARRGGGRDGTAEAITAVMGPGAAASDAILRGQVAQLRRQVRLQWCAVDASSAVTCEVRF